MEKKFAAGIVIMIIVVSMLMGFIFADPQSVQSQSQSNGALITVFIRPDGSIYPSDVPILRDGNRYTFTNNLFATMKIQKSNIVLDGAGYSLYGSYNGTQVDVWVIGEGPDQLPQGIMAEYTIGIDLGSQAIEGITIQNLNIRNFSIGMYMWTQNNTVTRNSICENIVGILLSGLNNSVTYNYVENNKRGLFFGFNNLETDEIIPSDIIINHNDFENNEVQLNGCLCKDYNSSEPPHSWDNGREGNFWSDYTGIDGNGDGVGDTAYVIDLLNQDRYPLMQSPAKVPTPTLSQTTVLPIDLIVFTLIFVALASSVLLGIWLRGKRK